MDTKTILDELAREYSFKDASAHCLPPDQYANKDDEPVIYCRVTEGTLDFEDVNFMLSAALKQKMWAVFRINGTTVIDMNTDRSVDLHSPNSVDELRKSFEGRAWDHATEDDWKRDLEIWQRVSKLLSF